MGVRWLGNEHRPAFGQGREIHAPIGQEYAQGAEMAQPAVGIRSVGALGVGGIARLGLSGGSVMGVAVVPHMGRPAPGFVLTIGARSRPAELERQKNREENRKPEAHGGEYSGSICCPARRAPSLGQQMERVQACACHSAKR